MKNRILKWFDVLQFPSEWKDATVEAISRFDLEETEKQENQENIQVLFMCLKSKKILKTS